MVAASILLIGMLGTLAMFDRAAQSTAQSSARERATSLAREVLEKSRVISYAQLDAAAVSATLKARPELASTTTSGWTIERQGVKYVVTPEVCALDDIADGYGARSGATFCAGLPPGAGDDVEPIDFKRLSVSVSYTIGEKTGQVRAASVRSVRSGADAPRVRSIVATSPAMTDPAAPVVTGSTTTSVTFGIVAGSTAQSVTVSIDGVDVGSATAVGNAKDWNFTLPVSTRPDGTYEVGARATDARGSVSPTLTIPLVLSRTVPSPPADLEGGRNEVVQGGTRVGVAELDWLASEQRNVVGYRAYRPDGSLACPSGPTVTDTTTSCVDFAPLTGTYGVATLYRDAAGTLRESARATIAVGPLSGRSFFFAPGSAANDDCGFASQYGQLSETYAGTANETIEPQNKFDDTLRFCTPQTQAAATFPAGTTRLYVWMTNTNNKPCTVTFTYTVGAASTATMTQTIPASTFTPVEYPLSASTASYAVGNQYLGVRMARPNTKDCEQTNIHFGGTARRTRIALTGTSLVLPSAPTGLTASAQADGSVNLSWAASPTAGVASYRIYRDGIEVANRYDRTGDASTTYVDPNRDGGMHVYRVTAVTDTLTESLPAGPVTG